MNWLMFFDILTIICLNSYLATCITGQVSIYSKSFSVKYIAYIPPFSIIVWVAAHLYKSKIR